MFVPESVSILTDGQVENTLRQSSSIAAWRCFRLSGSRLPWLRILSHACAALPLINVAWSHSLNRALPSNIPCSGADALR